MDDFADKIRGMLLLGAYGDALGAPQEASTEIATPPFAKLLVPQKPLSQSDPWASWLNDSVVDTITGAPTDDSCYRFFLLEPWLNEIAQGNYRFSEAEFRTFLPQLKTQSLQPDWLTAPRNAQIDAWLEMFDAQGQGTSAHFFAPGLPIVFGMFMYLEPAIVLHKQSPTQTYDFYRQLCSLDQGYTASATAFLCTLVSLCRAPTEFSDSFDQWFLQNSNTILSQLQNAQIDMANVAVLARLVDSMFALGVENRGASEFDFVDSFKQGVIDPETPPFMDQSFSGRFDPYRFLAQIVATVAYAQGDPFVALRCIALSIGDTDTTASFLGTLMGAWFGEQQLRRYTDNDFSADRELSTVEDCLQNTFGIELAKRVEIFQSLRNHDLNY